MEFARKVVLALCFVFGSVMGQLWHGHEGFVIVAGIVWAILLFVFYLVINYMEARQVNYSGRHRG
jgi:hypothetical protein